jgi:hypothetical protein
MKVTFSLKYLLKIKFTIDFIYNNYNLLNKKMIIKIDLMKFQSIIL